MTAFFVQGAVAETATSEEDDIDDRERARVARDGAWCATTAATRMDADRAQDAAAAPARHAVIRESRTHGRGYVSLRDVLRQLEGARHELQQLRTERDMRAAVPFPPLALAEEVTAVDACFCATDAELRPTIEDNTALISTNRKLKTWCESLKICLNATRETVDELTVDNRKLKTWCESLKVCLNATRETVDELTTEKKALKATLDEQAVKLDEANDSLKDMGALNAKKNALQKALDKETTSTEAPLVVALADAGEGGAREEFTAYERPPSAQLECAICLAAVVEAPSSLVAESCDHVFCHACLVGAMRADRRCPMCRVAAGDGGAPESVVKRSRRDEEMVLELRVHCPHGVAKVDGRWRRLRGGCAAVVARGALAQHLASCAFAEVGCATARGCTWRGAAQARSDGM